MGRIIRYNCKTWAWLEGGGCRTHVAHGVIASASLDVALAPFLLLLPLTTPTVSTFYTTRMAVLSLPLNFGNSFWSQGYRRGLEVLFDKLDQVLHSILCGDLFSPPRSTRVFTKTMRSLRLSWYVDHPTRLWHCRISSRTM